MKYKKVLEDYISAWNTQDIDEICTYFTPDVSYTDQAVGKTFDIKSVAVFLRNFIGNYAKEFRVDITYYSEDPKAETLAYEWDVQGISETGARMFIKGITMIEMEGLKIKKKCRLLEPG